MLSISQLSRAPRILVTLVVATALVLAGTAIASALVDEFGGGSFTVPYAPYTAGPVVDERPYAPYTAGPVVREVTRPYAPYTAGPVIHPSDVPYAPYTAGPVVREVRKAPDPYEHYPYR